MQQEKVVRKGKRKGKKGEPDLYPPDWNKLVPTQVRLYPDDWNKFQTHPDLQGRMAEISRELVHNFLSANGYSESALIAKIRDVDGDIRELTGVRSGYEMQLKSILLQKFDEEEAALKKDRRSLVVMNLKVMWAEHLYILRKAASLQTKERSPQEDLDWVGQKLKGSEELTDHADTPEAILTELEALIESKKDEFEAKFQAEHIHSRRG